MQIRIKIFALLVVALLTACGGGGGSAGATGSASSSNTTSTSTLVVTASPTLAIELRDTNGNLTASISGGGTGTASAKLLDASGKAVINRLVGFTADSALVKLTPASGSVLTDANGIASVQISPVSLLVSGASTIKASAELGTTTLSASFDYQVSSTNLALRVLDLGAATLAAYGNRAISVQVIANNSPVTTPVQVSFATSCGSIGSTVNTDANGFATTTYKADSQNCAGTNVSISASAVGTTPLSGQISVLPTAATNIQFVSTAPTLIYLRDSGAVTQALVTFKVVDSNGNPQQNQSLQLSFVNAGPGVSIDVVGNSATVTKTSDASGNVSVAVFSGTVPTPVQVRATLAANTAVTTTSGILTVASGRPVQSAASIAAVKLSLEGFNFDGDTTPITFSIADRQGNPVPDGTVVNFVSQSGVMVPPSCVITGGTSQCSSTIRTQGTRPTNGRVSVLAYVQGEKDFVDANFNNVYDAGEAFTDLGNAYRSDPNDKLIPSDNAKAANWTYRVGEFSVPRGDASSYVSCTGGESGRPNTCDGKWGAVDVRKQQMIVFATTAPAISGAVASVAGISLTLSDLNGNSMPTGTTLGAEKVGGSDACTIKAIAPSPLANSFDPAFVVINLDKCLKDDVIRFTVTTPVTKTATSFNFKLP